jgi:hypothetical protein
MSAQPLKDLAVPMPYVKTQFLATIVFVPKVLLPNLILSLLVNR